MAPASRSTTDAPYEPRVKGWRAVLLACALGIGYLVLLVAGLVYLAPFSYHPDWRTPQPRDIYLWSDCDVPSDC